MPVVVKFGKNRLRMIRALFGFICFVVGLALLLPPLAAAGGWTSLNSKWTAINLPSGIEFSSTGPGLALSAVGLLILWVDRRLAAQAHSKRPVDVEPIAQWVKEFQRHQAELQFRRGYGNLRSSVPQKRPAPSFSKGFVRSQAARF